MSCQTCKSKKVKINKENSDTKTINLEPTIDKMYNDNSNLLFRIMGFIIILIGTPIIILTIIIYLFNHLILGGKRNITQDGVDLLKKLSKDRSKVSQDNGYKIEEV